MQDSDGAKLAQSLGIKKLPAIAVWPDGMEEGQTLNSSRPVIHSIQSLSDEKQRKELISAVKASARPSVPLLGPHNFYSTCGPDARNGRRFCALLLVPLHGEGWPSELYTSLSSLTPPPRVNLAWVDADRQLSFARFLQSGSHKGDEQ